MREGPKVHPTAVVDEGAQLGARTAIWHFCHVMSGSRLGEDCSLGQNVFVASNVTIGDRVRIQNNVSLYEGVLLEDDVFVGPSIIFTNVHHPRISFPRRDQYLETVIRRGATLGANSTIVCGHEIGAWAVVAAGAVVTRDVAPHALVVGIPARQTGWACRCGSPLPDSTEGVCPECQRPFRVVTDQFEEIT